MSAVVWVVSEGPRDHGRDGEGGALLGIVRSALGPDWDCRGRLSTGRKHGGFGRKPTGRRLQLLCREFSGPAHRFCLALLDAGIGGIAALVFVHDVDQHGKKAKRKYRELMQQLSEARETVSAENKGVPSAAGMAVPMVDAWLLGDPAAFERALGRRPDDVPTKPEDHTTNRSGKNYAKSVLERCLDAGGAPGQRVEQYGVLGAAVCLDEVASACPLSFAPFLAELHALAKALNDPQA